MNIRDQHKSDLQKALYDIRRQYELSFSYPPDATKFVALHRQVFNVAIKLCNVYGVLRQW